MENEYSIGIYNKVTHKVIKYIQCNTKMAQRKKAMSVLNNYNENYLAEIIPHHKRTTEIIEKYDINQWILRMKRGYPKSNFDKYKKCKYRIIFSPHDNSYNSREFRLLNPDGTLSEWSAF